MAALSANKDRDSKGACKIQQFPVSDTEHIYEGALVCIDEDGYLVAATDATNRVLAGVAMEEANNIVTVVGHADGFVNCRVYQGGRFKFASANLVQSDVGIKVFVSNDNTIDPADVPSNDVLVGVLVERVSATEGWVEIDSGCVVGALT